MAIYSSKLNKENLYYFRYKAKGAQMKTLHAYDRAPLVIFLHITSKYALGVNIHWIPRNYRRPFLELIESISRKVGKGKFQRFIPKLYYKMFKTNTLLGKYGLHGLRMYIPARMSSVKVIPPELWDKVIGNPRYRERKVYRDRGYKLP